MVPESLPSSFHVLTRLILKIPYEIGTIIVPTLQIKKLRHKEVIKFCKDTQLASNGTVFIFMQSGSRAWSFNYYNSLVQEDNNLPKKILCSHKYVINKILVPKLAQKGR